MMGKSTFSIFSLVLFVSLVGSPISSSAGGSDYHVLINGEQKGPMTTEQLEELKQDGTLTSDTMVWKGGMAAWGKAGGQEDLEKLFAAAAPPPAPPPTPSVPPPTPGSEGQQAGSGEDVSETLADTNEAPIELSVSDQIRQALEAYREAKGFDWGVSSKGSKIYSYKIKVVESKPNSKSWGKARSLAFDDALLGAQADFIRDQFGTQTVVMGKKLFEDASDDAEEFESKANSSGMAGRLNAIANKVVALGDATLSNKLDEMGVDPSQFDAAPKSEKKVLFMEQLTKKAMVRAVGSISGLVPIQTFEGRTEKGTHAIAVIMMYSPKLKDLASDIANKRVPILRKTKGKGKPVKTFVPKDSKILVNQFGLRVGFDENNVPYLVSYGQWSYIDKGLSERKRERRRESARASAESIADSQITMFLAGRLSYNDEKVTGSYVEEVIKAIFNPDGSVGDTEKIEIENMIDKTNKTIEANAKAEMAGRQTVLPMWTYKDAPGATGDEVRTYDHEIVGVVRAWTLAGALTSAEIKGQPLTSRPTPPQTPEIKAGVKSGKDQMDTDDF
jgi:hypothetical protein